MQSLNGSCLTRDLLVAGVLAGLVTTRCLSAAEKAPAAPAPKAEKVFLKGPDPKKAYPRFHVGVTGIYLTIEKGLVVTVDGTEPDTPAAGKFNKGDVVTAVNGRSLGVPDARVVLGEAVGAAEAGDGKLVFAIQRHAGEEKVEQVDVAVTIPVLGAYSDTWPLQCTKSDTVVRQTAEFVASSDMLEKTGVCNCLAGLFLLSTGDDKYLPVVKAQVQRFPGDKAGSHTWNNGYGGILLGEYYLRTGDASALPALKAICDDSRDRQYFGGWNHWGGCNTGYVQGGLMNPAGLQILTTLILAAECGVDVDQGTLNRALKFFYRFAGHGAVPYGDHRNEGWLSSNGKNGMLAAALSLLPGEAYQAAAHYFGLDLTDSYRWLLSGHTGGGFDVIWRGIGSVHVPPNKQDHYRRQMDKLAWYYDLCREPKGGFSMVGGERYGSVLWGTGGMGLAYTAPRRTLRITGALPTKYSHKVVVPARPWGKERDLVFLSADYCEGFGKEELEPHEIYDRLGDAYNKPTADDVAHKAFFVKMTRHYNAVARTQAAAGLGRLGAVDEIVTALKHPDPRVKRAGLDAISMYRYWWGGGKGSLPPDVVSEKCVGLIVEILRNPASSLYEVDGALNALGFAEAADVVKQLDVVRGYLRDEEWWLREASWRALRPVLKDEALVTPLLPDLLDCFAREIHVMPRRVFMNELRSMLKNKDLSAGLKDRVTAGMLKAMHDTEFATGYREPIGVTAVYETMRYLNLAAETKPAPRAMAEMERVLPELPTMLSIWLFNGDRWGNPGLLKCADKLGKDAGPMIAGFKRMLPVMKGKATGRDKEAVQELLEKMTVAINAYDAR